MHAIRTHLRGDHFPVLTAKTPCHVCSQNVPKDIPIVICGNKADCVSDRQVQASEAKALAQQLNCLHFETSARTGANIDQMFIALARLTYRDVPKADANVKQVVDVTPTPASSCC